MKRFFIGLPLMIAGAFAFAMISAVDIKNHEPPFDECPWEGCF